MRTPIEALKEIRDRLTYFCLRTDGKYNPPWATELVGIIDEAVTACHAIGNAAAMREALEHVEKLAREFAVGNYYLSDFPKMLLDAIQTALAAPPRNCDIYPTNEDAWRRYQLSHAKNADAYVEATVPDFIDWLFAPADKGADA